MSVLKDMITKEIVEPMILKRVHTSTGTILSYDQESNTASIQFGNGSGGMSVAYGVCVPIPANGMHCTDPKVGDSIVVTFTGGEITSPKIASFYDAKYRQNKRAPEVKYGPDIPDFFSSL